MAENLRTGAAENSRVFTRYRAYGLAIDCDSTLPELNPSGTPDRGSADVEVRLKWPCALVPEPNEWFTTDSLPDGTPWMACGTVGNWYFLRFFRFADFLISRDGSRVACQRVESGVSPVTVRHLLLDQVFPFVLNRLGRQAMHATAIATSRGVCAFAGPAGSGKSTLAASFFLAGFSVFGDDCLALQYEGRVTAAPAYPGIRLWNDSQARLLGSAGGSMPVADYTTKRRVLGTEIARDFPRDPKPLIRVYRLARNNGDSLSIEQLSPREALIEMVSLTYQLDVNDREALSRHFNFFKQVAAEVPVKRLTMPDRLDSLGSVREAILRDLEDS